MRPSTPSASTYWLRLQAVARQEASSGCKIPVVLPAEDCSQTQRALLLIAFAAGPVVVYDVRPVATAREETQLETQFSLDRDRRQRLLKGDTRAFVFTGDKDDPKPYGCAKGATYVVTWSKSQRSLAGEQVIEIPRQATCYIVVTDVRRHRKGGWMVRFDMHDHREQTWYMRRTPPVWNPEAAPRKKKPSRPAAPVMIRKCGKCGNDHWMHEGCSKIAIAA